jgi:hypothetical protein
VGASASTSIDCARAASLQAKPNTTGLVNSSDRIPQALTFFSFELIMFKFTPQQ